MKLGLTGFLLELDQITFKIGSVLQVTMTLPHDDYVLIEKVRTIKHYDRFFRRPPKKNAQGELILSEEKPKKLIEAHFVQLRAENRLAVERYLLSLSVQQMKREK